MFLKKCISFVYRQFKHLLIKLARIFFQRWIGLIWKLKTVSKDENVDGFKILKIRGMKAADKYEVVRQSEETIVYIPPHINSDKNEKLKVSTPDLFVAEINNATVVGLTNIICAKENLYNNHANLEGKRIDISYGDLIYNIGKVAIVASRKVSKKIPEAISIVQAGNYNYYHFFIESLSRLVLVDTIEKYRKVPVLIDAVVKKNKNYKDLLDKCNTYNHPVIWIEENEHILVEKLIYASSAIFMPGNVRKRDMIRNSDFVVSKWLLNSLRDRFEYPGMDHGEGNKKIIISRKNTSNSRLSNEKEIVETVVRSGFEVIYPESLTVLQQAEIFRSSDKIIAVSGGAMANILFCKPGTNVYCIIPDEHRFYLYSTMAYLLGLNYVAVSGEISEKVAYPGMDEFTVDVKVFENI